MAPSATRKEVYVVNSRNTRLPVPPNSLSPNPNALHLQGCLRQRKVADLQYSRHYSSHSRDLSMKLAQYASTSSAIQSACVLYEEHRGGLEPFAEN